MESHEQQLNKFENTILEHKKGPIPSKGLALQNYKEKEVFLQYEVIIMATLISLQNSNLICNFFLIIYSYVVTRRMCQF